MFFVTCCKKIINVIKAKKIRNALGMTLRIFMKPASTCVGEQKPNYHLINTKKSFSLCSPSQMLLFLYSLFKNFD